MASDKGFTVIELLLSITLISFFLVALLIALNPRGAFEKARDVQRFNDLQSISVALTTLFKEKPELSFGEENVIYLSLPRLNSATCSEYDLPIITSSYQYRCSLNPEATDGTGWLPVNFDLHPIIGFKKLPLDPVNKPPLFYAYRIKNNLIKLTARFENIRNLQASYFDGGNDPLLYELGEDLSLIVPESGLTFSYPLEDGTGTVAQDNSGFRFQATLFNFDFNTSSGWTQAKIGKGLIFDGLDDYVKTTYAYQTNQLSALTTCFWFFSTSTLEHTLLSFGTSSYWGITLEDGRIKFYTKGSDGSVDVISAGKYNDGEWHFVCAWYQATSTPNKKLFIDGKRKASTIAHQQNPLGDGSEKFAEIGRDPVSLSGYYLGKIDEILLYQKAITEAEIKMLFLLTK